MPATSVRAHGWCSRQAGVEEIHDVDIEMDSDPIARPQRRQCPLRCNLRFPRGSVHIHHRQPQPVDQSFSKRVCGPSPRKLEIAMQISSVVDLGRGP